MQENLPLSFRLRFRIEQYSQSNSAANQQLKVERSHCLVYNHRFISPRIQIHTETESCGLQSLRSQRLDSPWCSHGPVMYWIGGLSGSGLQAVEAEGVPAQGCPPMLFHLQLSSAATSTSAAWHTLLHLASVTTWWPRLNCWAERMELIWMAGHLCTVSPVRELMPSCQGKKFVCQTLWELGLGLRTGSPNLETGSTESRVGERDSNLSLPWLDHQLTVKVGFNLPGLSEGSGAGTVHSGAGRNTSFSHCRVATENRTLFA